MRLTRSSNRSSSSLAVGEDGVALRRSRRVSSVPTKKASVSSPSRSLAARKDIGRSSKSPVKSPHTTVPTAKRSTTRDSASPGLALTAASRVQVPLTDFEERYRPPSAALAVVGPPTASPFVKRAPLFIQRPVYPYPALQPDVPVPSDSTRLILYQPVASTSAFRVKKRSRSINFAVAPEPAEEVVPTKRERPSPMPTLSSVEPSTAKLADQPRKQPGSFKVPHLPSTFRTTKSTAHCVVDISPSRFKQLRPKVGPPPLSPPKVVANPKLDSPAASFGCVLSSPRRDDPRAERVTVDALALLAGDGQSDDREEIVLVSPRCMRPHEASLLTSEAALSEESDEGSVEGDWEEVSEEDYYASLRTATPTN